MKKMKLALSLLLVLSMLLSCFPVMAAEPAPAGDIVLADQTGAAPIYIDRDSLDYDGLSLIAMAVGEDFEAITGQKSEVYAVATAATAVNQVLEPEIKDHVVTKIGSEKVVIIAGTVNDKLIESLGQSWDIIPSGESFKAADFERYQIKVLTEGDQTRIVVAGADKRGTIYGLFHITQDLCGVSPWIWWADVPPTHYDSLAFDKAELETVSKRPSVNYRGFFFNDENPNLDGFADSHFGGLNYMFYDHVFELMLRLKGNFLWPAMWSNSFNSDGVEGLGDANTIYGTLSTNTRNKFAQMESDYHYLLGGAMYVDQPGNEGAACGAPNTNTTNYTQAESKALGDGSLTAIDNGEYPMTLANAVLADRYGVMVGASHHEPMARGGVEWGNVQGYNNNTDTYTQPTVTGATDKKSRQAWNYLTNPTNLSNFWSDGVKRNGSFDNLLTIGMRGENDTALTDANGTTLSTKQNAQLLKDVIREQDRILRQYGLEDTPQLIALYKEVENCWYAGDRNNPSAADKSAALYSDSEITSLLGADTNRIVMFCEDNNGYLRTLGEYGEKDRFNYGLYYHFDFVGSPHTSMWTNTMPLQRSWDNLTTAYEYGVDDAWIVNVGDLKPMELPLSYFMDMAYDFETYGTNAAEDTEDTITAQEYYELWARKQFAADETLTDADYQALAQILKDYTQLNGNRKPEQQKNNTYNLTSYNEAQRTLAMAKNIEEKADYYLQKFKGTALYDAYYELVYYTAIESANTNKLLICQGLNQLYAGAKSALANVYADKVDAALAADRAYTAEYNKLGPVLNGQNKWYRMMITSPFNNETVCGITARAHLNYSSWNNDSSQTFSPTRISLNQAGSMLVNISGNANFASSGSLTMPDFDNTVKQAYYISLSNTGTAPVEYSFANVPAWVILDGETSGHFTTAATIGVSVDWSKVSADTTDSFQITTTGGQSVTVAVNAKVLQLPASAPEGTALPSNGEYSFIATNYTAMGVGYSKAGDNKELGWVSIPGYGKTEGSVKPFPVYTDDCAAGKGPWLDYTVYVPAGQNGSYSLNIFFGQSNDISFFEGKELNFALQVNGGAVQTKNALTNNYVAGGNGWYDNINNCGHTMSYGNITLNEGLNTVRIYAMDQNLLLQKLVISKGSTYKSSYLGAPQSYRKGDAEPEQQMLVFDSYVDHDHVYDPVVVEPTCTEGGSITGKCTICGTTIVTYTKALGHDWDEGVVTLEPTTTTAGSKRVTCQRCNLVKDVRIPRIGATVPDDIDFTDATSADRFEVVNQASTLIKDGQGLYLITTKDGFEPANDQLTGTAATTPKDLVLIPVEGDWIATMKFDFSQASASNGYYQFFGFYAMQDYNNAAGIRGGNGAMQNFLRVSGTVTADTEELNSKPGLGSNGTYWYRIIKEGTTYTCLRSSDGDEFTEMFSYMDTGIEAENIAIDAYTGMTAGYEFLVKSLSFEEVGGSTHTHQYTAVVTAPTCTEKGYTTYTCACGDSYKADEKAALGHSWDAGVVTKQPTATAEGVKTYTCTRCKLTKTEAIPVEGWVNNADISWIDSSKKVVAFTFDDGPVGTAPGVSSQRILDVMEKYHIHCTYFYWGEKITNAMLPELQRAYSLGCELGNHSYTHPYLTNMTSAQITEEIKKTNDLVSPISGNARTVVRPPYGSVNSTVQTAVGAPLINWSLDSGDWNNGSYNSVVSTIRSRIKDGDIILFHQTYDFTAQAIETLVPELMAQGYEIVSVSELMKIKGVTLQAGTVYSNQANNKKNVATDYASIGLTADKITAIGTVTTGSEAAIKAARTAYDALSAAQKARVSNYSALTAAEEAFENLGKTAEADQKAAKAVDEQIAAIGTVTLDSEAAITVASAAYDALTDAQKALVKNEGILTAAKATLAALKADAQAAKAVDEQIAAIGTVTMDSEAAITAARSAYDALTDAQKALVAELAALTAAEAALEELYSELPFIDVSGWYESAVRFVYRNKLMNGLSETVFAPNGSLTRAQLVTILYRMEGEPTITTENTFTDVKPGVWYYQAIEWAAAKKVVNGVGDNRFDPDGKITREQIATILYRYNGAPAVEGDLSRYPDGASVSTYAVNAMIWATGKGLINGVASNGKTSLMPRDNATRAQIAAIIMRYIENP